MLRVGPARLAAVVNSMSSRTQLEELLCPYCSRWLIAVAREAKVLPWEPCATCKPKAAEWLARKIVEEENQNP